MITFSKSYLTESGIFKTLEEAQGAELSALFQVDGRMIISEADTAAGIVLAHSDEVLDILTTTATSKPKARKVNGGKKTRKTKEAPENLNLGE